MQQVAQRKSNRIQSRKNALDQSVEKETSVDRVMELSVREYGDRQDGISEPPSYNDETEEVSEGDMEATNDGSTEDLDQFGKYACIQCGFSFRYGVCQFSSMRGGGAVFDPMLCSVENWLIFLPLLMFNTTMFKSLLDVVQLLNTDISFYIFIDCSVTRQAVQTNKRTSRLRFNFKIDSTSLAYDFYLLKLQ